MNLQWIKTKRGEVLRDVDAPNGVIERVPDVRRGAEPHIACSVPPWTPGARRYVTDRKSEHYGQPIVESDRDRRNIEAASNGQFRYDRTQERARARLAESRRRSGTG